MEKKQSNEKDNPGVIAPPPLIFLTGILLGGILHWFYRVLIFPPEYLFLLRISGASLLVTGLAIVAVAKIKMQRADTNIEPWKPTNSIIDDGIYAYSRNPIYVAMILMYFGLTLIFNAIWFLPFLILVLLVMHYGVILREEKYLEKKFGEDYLNYKREVRRWI
jgi:protein-S-isoprenylcysteine O-methyltransferase Ste14